MKNDRILLDHGSGGRLSHDLVSGLFLPLFENSMLSALNDGAVFDVPGGRLAFSTDTFVVDPLFFPGGNIGDLAINGTVNDLAMCGSIPRFISVGLVIEEGFAVRDLERILLSMRDAAKKADVQVVTGDTKVVPRGAADSLFINTSGIGLVIDRVDVGGDKARTGDKVIVSGNIADHGIAVITQREGFSFSSSIKSDTTCLNHFAADILNSSGNIHVLRDPTRGGLGTTLSEIARQSGVSIRIRETDIPVSAEVAGACELLGFDPLYVANEGKMVVVVAPEDAEKVLDVMKGHECGRNASIIGEVKEGNPGRVVMETSVGGLRMVEMLTGEQLPRIC